MTLAIKFKRLIKCLLLIWGMVMLFAWGTESSPKEYIRSGYEFLRANNMEVAVQFASVVSIAAFIAVFFFPSAWESTKKEDTLVDK